MVLSLFFFDPVVWKNAVIYDVNVRMANIFFQHCQNMVTVDKHVIVRYIKEMNDAGKELFEVLSLLGT